MVCRRVDSVVTKDTCLFWLQKLSDSSPDLRVGYLQPCADDSLPPSSRTDVSSFQDPPRPQLVIFPSRCSDRAGSTPRAQRWAWGTDGHQDAVEDKMDHGRKAGGWVCWGGHSRNMHEARDCDDFRKHKERKRHVPWLRRKQNSQKAKITTRWF